MPSAWSAQAEYVSRLKRETDIRGHLPFLYETACAYKMPRIVELGVRSGNSTSAFLAAAEANDGYVWSADIDRHSITDWPPQLPYWSFYQGDDTDPDLVARIWGAAAPADVLFIDTSHAYTHTLAELQIWVPIVRPGGTVLLHDTEYQPTMYETAGRPQPPWPVMRAMREYCAGNGLAYENRPGYNGLGVIRIPED